MSAILFEGKVIIAGEGGYMWYAQKQLLRSAQGTFILRAVHTARPPRPPRTGLLLRLLGPRGVEPERMQENEVISRERALKFLLNNGMHVDEAETLLR